MLKKVIEDKLKNELQKKMQEQMMKITMGGLGLGSPINLKLDTLQISESHDKSQLPTLETTPMVEGEVTPVRA